MRNIFKLIGYLRTKVTPQSIEARIISKGLTYLSMQPLLTLGNIVKEIEVQEIKGVFIEAGCALGGSAIQIASKKAKGRKLKVYDTFEMIPAPSEKDGPDVHERYQIIISGESKGINGGLYYGYRKDLKEFVHKNLLSFGFNAVENEIELIEGLFEEKMVINEPVAFAHVDCDWYDSVSYCCEQIVPHLAIGAVIVFDDYFVYSGCKKAVDEYFVSDYKRKFRFEKKNDKLIVTKTN